MAVGGYLGESNERREREHAGIFTSYTHMGSVEFAAHKCKKRREEKCVREKKKTSKRSKARDRARAREEREREKREERERERDNQLCVCPITHLLHILNS
jgi:hypothetical protein